MKKFLVITVLALFLALPVIAATNDFTADADITVDPVVGDVTKNLTIVNGSTAESWSYTASNTLTVTNPGSFTVSATSSAVVSFLIKNSSGVNVACALNSTPGTSYVTLPTTSDTYTVYPSTTASCSALCTTVTGAATYYQSNGTYTLPSCGVATCSNPYSLSAASASTSTSCNPPAVSSGGGGGSSATPATPAEPATPATPTETPATPAEPATPATPSANAYAQQWQNVLADAATIISDNLESLLSAMGAVRSITAEVSASSKYTTPLVSGLKNITAEMKNAITNFVNYGTPTTKILGAGERAGVLNSYKSAYGKVPVTEAEWKDAIAIGNGRWPGEKSAAAEAQATVEFKKVYKRSPDMSQPHDNAAVTVISYGLRPANRNLNSEKAAIKSFRAIYGHNPVNALAWDIVRAIAYSGATR